MHQHKKIDIFVDMGAGFVYKCSTTWSKTCKEALEHFLQAYPEMQKFRVKANFSKTC